jgi:MOSC domain-containing protein YiiM
MTVAPHVRVVSVNVSRVRTVPWKGTVVATGIYKEPVRGPVRIGDRGLEGDEQADLDAHGGPSKAVYLYPSEHYDFWRRELPDLVLGWGAFGENITTSGLLEGGVRVGDRLRAGTAVLRVTKPRFPCYKLGIRFGREDIVDRFLRSGRSGFYAAILERGAVTAGDPIEFEGRGEGRPTITEIVMARLQGGDEEE